MWTGFTVPELGRHSESCSSVGLRTSVRAYRAQMDAGRYILHEHPKGARSWEEKNFETIHVFTKLLGLCAGGKWNQKTRETRA